jgi:hypothetical protein
MYRLLQFLKARWEEIVWLGIWFPIITAAIFSGSVIVIVLSIVGGIASIMVLYLLVAQIEKLRRKKPTFGGEASTVPRKGLIFTVGLQTDTLAFCLQVQKPHYVGFLCSEQTLHIVDSLVVSHGISADRRHREVVDPRDIADVRAKTFFLIDWMLTQGPRAEDIAVDPTGGMTSMSLGAFSAAQERKVDCQYLLSSYDERNRPIEGTQRLIFITRYAEGLKEGRL